MLTSLRLRVCLSLFTTSLLALGASATLRGQELITITGVVTDASGGVLPGATVETVAAGRRFAMATTGADGRYQVDTPAGVPVEVRVRLDGFSQRVIAIAGSSEPLSRNVVLPVAGLSDTLIVTSESRRIVRRK